MTATCGLSNRDIRVWSRSGAVGTQHVDAQKNPFYPVQSHAGAKWGSDDLQGLMLRFRHLLNCAFAHIVVRSSRRLGRNKNRTFLQPPFRHT